MKTATPSKKMKRRIPILPRLIVRSQFPCRRPYSLDLPGYDEVSEIIRLAQHSEEGLDIARRILVQLAHKALKSRRAVEHYKLYQLALEDIGEKFEHAHKYASTLSQVS